MLRLIILSCGWDVFRLAMACKFFDGLPVCVGCRQLSTESAGDGEKQRWLTATGLLRRAVAKSHAE